MRYLARLILLTSLVSVSAFGADVASKKVVVVTTLPVLKDITQEIGGEFVVVDSLAEPNQNAHSVPPNPTLMKKTAKADAFVEIGLALEQWGQKVIDGTGNSRVQMGQPGRIIVSNGISAVEVPPILSRDFGDVHPNGNPHIWLDPINVKQIGANIAAGLSKVDPVHQDAYAKNLEKFQNKVDTALFGDELVKIVGAKKLTRLAELGNLLSYLQEKKLISKLGGWQKKAQPLAGKKIITYHRSWSYFASRFGFTTPMELEDKPGIPPSAKHQSEVIAFIQQNKVPVILMEIFYDRQPQAEYVASKTNAIIVQVPIDVGAVKGVDNYFTLIDHILDQLLATKKF